MTNFVIYHFITGNVFFLGLVMSCIALGIWPRVRAKNRIRPIATVCAVLGLLLVAFSAVPLPWYRYGIWLALLVMAWSSILPAMAKPSFWVALVYLMSLSLAARELVYQRATPIDVSKFDILYVIGDSLSIGADPPHRNWPDLLGDRLGMTTHTFAHGGARTDTALDNANRVDEESALVMIEIGGNDLLYGTPGFDQNLEAILKAVSNGKRQTVMLELPLPPTYNRYGIAQRTLARRYNVSLIPKRCLASVITADGATTDSLHLSNRGHDLLAEALVPYFAVHPRVIGAAATPASAEHSPAAPPATTTTPPPSSGSQLE